MQRSTQSAPRRLGILLLLAWALCGCAASAGGAADGQGSSRSYESPDPYHIRNQYHGG